MDACSGYAFRNHIADFLLRCQLLLDQLCPDEWREVRAQARNSLKRDILGSIPVELVVEIVRYLDISDVFMFQRVYSTKQLTKIE